MIRASWFNQNFDEGGFAGLVAAGDVALSAGDVPEPFVDVNYTQVPHADFLAGVSASGAPKDVAWMMDYLFSTVLDGRNAHVTDGVERALGRKPRDFSDYEGIATMQSINIVVLNRSFLGIFIGTAVVSLPLAALALVHWNDPRASYFRRSARLGGSWSWVDAMSGRGDRQEGYSNRTILEPR